MKKSKTPHSISYTLHIDTWLVILVDSTYLLVFNKLYFEKVINRSAVSYRLQNMASLTVGPTKNLTHVFFCNAIDYSKF